MHCDVVLHFDGAIRLSCEYGHPRLPWVTEGIGVPHVTDWILDTLNLGSSVAVWSWRSRYPLARPAMRRFLQQIAANHHFLAGEQGLRRWQRAGFHSTRTEGVWCPPADYSRNPDWEESLDIATLLTRSLLWPRNIPVASRLIDDDILRRNGGYVGIRHDDFMGVNE